MAILIIILGLALAVTSLLGFIGMRYNRDSNPEGAAQHALLMYFFILLGATLALAILCTLCVIARDKVNSPADFPPSRQHFWRRWRAS